MKFLVCAFLGLCVPQTLIASNAGNNPITVPHAVTPPNVSFIGATQDPAEATPGQSVTITWKWSAGGGTHRDKYLQGDPVPSTNKFDNWGVRGYGVADSESFTITKTTQEIAKNGKTWNWSIGGAWYVDPCDGVRTQTGPPGSSYHTFNLKPKDPTKDPTPDGPGGGDSGGGDSGGGDSGGGDSGGEDNTPEERPDQGEAELSGEIVDAGSNVMDPDRGMVPTRSNGYVILHKTDPADLNNVGRYDVPLSVLHRIVTIDSPPERDLEGVLQFSVEEGNAQDYIMFHVDSETGVPKQVPLPFSMNITEPGHSGGGVHDWHLGTEQFIFRRLGDGELKIKITVSPTKGSPLKVTYLHLMPASIAADMNRDGVITFDGQDSTSEENPYRFWVNNDSDHYAEEERLDGPPNGEYAEIDGIRDLEDVSQIKIKVPQKIVDLIKEGRAQLGLSLDDSYQAAPEIRVYAIPIDSGRNYLKNESAAVKVLDYGHSDNCVKVGGGFEQEVPAKWTGLLSDSGELLAMFEGVNVSTSKFTLSVKINGEWYKGASFDLKMMDVKSMFQRGVATVNNRTDGDAVPHPYIAEGVPVVMDWTWDNLGFPFDKDPSETKECVVHVHGWRMSEKESQNWAEMSFKRLWQTGYKGRFAAFRWPTYYGPFGGYHTYNPSEYRSWLSGKPLAAFVNQLPYEQSRHLIAHSMGNVISGSALRSGMRIKSYAMLNAAMSSLAYDGGVDIDYPSFASPDEPGEPSSVALMGLKNKFSGYMDGLNVINFYLPDDSALGSWTANNYAYKPEASLGYRFYSGVGPVTEVNAAEGGLVRRVLVYPGDLNEAMGYAVKSRTVAAGANGRVNGKVTTKINMNDSYSFGAAHSAEWIKCIQDTYLFWEKIGECFGLDISESY